MKNLILILSLFLTTLLYGQHSDSEFTIYTTEIAHWNHKSSKWVFDDVEYQRLTFSLYKGVLYVNDRAHSIYEPTKILDETDDLFSYEAIDEEGRDCVITIKNNKTGYDYIIIMYANKGLLYRYSLYF